MTRRLISGACVVLAMVAVLWISGPLPSFGSKGAATTTTQVTVETISPQEHVASMHYYRQTAISEIGSTVVEAFDKSVAEGDCRGAQEWFSMVAWDVNHGVPSLVTPLYFKAAVANDLEWCDLGTVLSPTLIYTP